MLTEILAVMLALPPPTASPPAHEPKTIITVVSSPYCKSLAEHFNDALVPMLANDRTLDGVSVQLDDFNTLFSQPNYVQQFLEVRDKLGRQVTRLTNSLEAIQREIDQLRDGARLTTDPQAAQQIHQAAADLQAAYDKQRQLTIDLQGVHQQMLTYPIYRVHPALGGFDPQEMAMPENARDIKAFLRFNGQRDVIAVNEDRGADIALAAADRYCVPK